MKVWIVTKHYAYEDTIIEAVFDSEEKAIADRDARRKEYDDRYGVTIDVEEWEVK